VLVSQTTRELLRDDPIPDVSLRDLGEHQLKDLDELERIYQLAAPGLSEDFPPLKKTAPAPFEGRKGKLAAAAQDAVAQMRKPWRRDRRIIGAVGLVAAAVAAVLGVLLTQGGTKSAGAAGQVAANAVGVLDARSGKLLTQIPVGEAPGGVAAGDGAVWVTNSDAGTVSRIDPRTNDVRQTIQVGGGPAGVAVGGRAVWVANGLDGTVSRIDPQTNQVVQTITVGNGPSGVAFGEGAVWVANSADGTLSRLDPDSGRVTRTTPAEVGVAGVAVGFGRVWLASPSAGSVAVVDPRSGAVEDRIGVGADTVAVTIGVGAVWAANRADGTVSKINPSARVVIATIQVGRSPSSVTAGPAGVWVSNGGDGTLSRIDPSRDAVVTTTRLANPPRGLALTPEGVYVAVRSTGVEHRGGTLRVLGGFLDSLDPALAYSGASWSILTSTNDGLVAFRHVGGVEGAQLVPDLAVSVPRPTEGGRTYTFTLREGIRYSSGQLVQPEDIRAELERVFAIKPASAGTQFYGGVVGADACRAGKACDLSRGVATDRLARSITFHLWAPDPDFLTKLALPFAYAVPHGTPAREAARSVPATGPYMVSAYRKAKLVTLVRNPRFHEWSADAQPQGYPDTIVRRFPPAADTGARIVERNQADVAVSISPPVLKQELDRLALRYPSRLHSSTAATTSYFFLNTNVRPFDDVRVRRAVNYAFDRQAFVELLGRSSFAPTCQILPPNFPGRRRTCPYLPGGLASLQKARSLVRASGTTGTRVTVWVPQPIARYGRYMASVLDSLGYRAAVKAVALPPAAGIIACFNQVLGSRIRAQTATSPGSRTTRPPSAS
jgi:YVTN family beta-propeller protein